MQNRLGFFTGKYRSFVPNGAKLLIKDAVLCFILSYLEDSIPISLARPMGCEGIASARKLVWDVRRDVAGVGTNSVGRWLEDEAATKPIINENRDALLNSNI